ncbi:MAG: alpha/beta hydrolase [Alphaproteobacteria bacterium]|nr:alpha/beta hydrolase [Alphaproteobacteria bacterium]
MPLPAPVPAQEGFADLPGTKLGYWDTGGTGTPVVFCHPASGSALSWPYQQPVFSEAGYRVVAYSRRNYYNSDVAADDDPGHQVEDLNNLADWLGLDRFHLVGCAAGGTVATDYTFSHRDRILSLTVCSNAMGVQSGEIAEAAKRIRPHGQWELLPRWFRELGPSYRAANPEGVKKWIEINELSETGKGARQLRANVVTPDMLAGIDLPVLLLTGDSDTSTPPAILRLCAKRIPNCRIRTVCECGHSIYWEQPVVFNATILDFLSMQGGG